MALLERSGEANWLTVSELSIMLVHVDAGQNLSMDERPQALLTLSQVVTALASYRPKRGEGFRLSMFLVSALSTDTVGMTSKAQNELAESTITIVAVASKIETGNTEELKKTLMRSRIDVGPSAHTAAAIRKRHPKTDRRTGSGRQATHPSCVDSTPDNDL